MNILHWIYGVLSFLGHDIGYAAGRCSVLSIGRSPAITSIECYVIFAVFVHVDVLDLAQV